MITRRFRRAPALFALALPVFTACGGGGDGGSTPPPQPPVVRTVSVTPAAATVTPGQSVQLQAQALDAAGAPITGRTVGWASQQAAIASVSSSGNVTGIAAGVATIAATIDGVVGTAAVTVRAQLDVKPDTISATAIGTTTQIAVTLNGQPVTTATYVQASEQRWLSERGVVDATQLSSGRVVSTGAGRVLIRVTAGGASDSVLVLVTPTQPHVFSVATATGATHVGTTDTLVVRAYRANLLNTGSITPSSAQATLIPVDSASARVVMPTLTTPTCTGRAPSLALAFTGTTGSGWGPFTRKRSGELSLAVGESRKLSAAEQSCLRFAPVTNARYLLAYADGRLAEQARTRAEWPWPDSVTISLADQGSSQPSARVAPSGNAGLPMPVQHMPVPGAAGSTYAVPAGCPYLNQAFPFCRATPYQLGQLITHYPTFTQRPGGNARVAVIRGNLVLAIFQADSSQLAPGALARADSAMLVMEQRAIPLLRSIFNLAAPTSTSDESGQLYMGIETGTTPGGASWFADQNTGHGRWGRIVFGLTPNSAFGFSPSTYASPLLIISHEVLHTYQFRWRFEHAGPWVGFLGTSWGIEGAATFFSVEMVREATGVPFLGNTVMNFSSGTDPRNALSLYGSLVGDFAYGYTNTSGFLRDLVQRLMGAGMTFDAAMREVLVGAMEGWHGINEENQARGLGMTARMRARLGASWNANDAMLDWTMSEAADDQTSNARFQNLTSRMSTPAPASSPFPPHAIVGPGVSSSRIRTPGSTGVFEIREDVGGSYKAAADVKGVATNQVGWLLLRIR